MDTLLQLLRDPLWQFIGIILAIALGVLIHRLQLSRKALTYKVLSSVPLLTIKEELEGKLALEYEGKHVSNVHLIILKLKNTGTVPIASSDYVQPVRISFAKARILSAETTEFIPSNLVTALVVEEQNIAITPTLLNSKDSITLKILVIDYENDMSIDGRIFGVKAIEEEKESIFSLTFAVMSGGLLLGAIWVIVNLLLYLFWWILPRIFPAG